VIVREGEEQAFAIAESVDTELAQVGVLKLVEYRIGHALLLEFRRQVLEVLGLENGFQFLFHG
jgi:hypothetical protein